MGYNSLVMILNDHYSAIDRDPKGWWEETKYNLTAWLTNRDQDSYGFGGSVNGFRAVWNRHADDYGLIFVGGNRAQVLGEASFSSHVSDEKNVQVELLRLAADRLGFKLEKK